MRSAPEKHKSLVIVFRLFLCSLFATRLLAQAPPAALYVGKNRHIDPRLCSKLHLADPERLTLRLQCLKVLNVCHLRLSFLSRRQQNSM